MEDIPRLSFRLPHSFALKPALEADKGPGGGVLIGRTSRDSADHSCVFLGKIAERPYPNAWLDTEGAHVIYVMGKRRSGKSYTLGVIAECLASESWMSQGQVEQGVLILDTMNVYLTMPFAAEDASTQVSIDDAAKWHLGDSSVPVKLFHPAGAEVPPGLSSIEFTLRPFDLEAEEWCGLFDVDPFADPLGHLMIELHGRVAVDGYFDSETGEEIQPESAFTLYHLQRALAVDPALDRYHRDTREALRRRLDVLRRLPIFSEQGLDVRELLAPKCISVLLLQDLDQHLRSVLVGFIVRKVMQGRAVSEQNERLLPIYEARATRLANSDPSAASQARELAEMARERAKVGLPRSWILIDEAHNYIPRSGFAASRKPLVKYVNEGRNLGLSIVVATQQPSGLDPSIQRNADILLVHSLSHRDDIRAADGMLNTALPDEVMIGTKTKISGPRVFESSARSLPAGYALVSNDRLNRLAPLLVRPRSTVHGGKNY